MSILTYLPKMNYNYYDLALQNMVTMYYVSRQHILVSVLEANHYSLKEI